MWTSILTWFKEYGTWILELTKEYGKKSVLIVLFVVSVLLTTVYVIDYKIKQVVPETIEQNTIELEEQHKTKLIETQEIYAAVKQRLRHVSKEVDCEYVYLIEYHNGSENVASAFPFYKFDVTMDVYKEGVPYIDISPLKDEHIYKYDIFDNSEFTEQQFTYCSIGEFQNVDRKLYNMAIQNPNIKWVYTYNLYYNGTLMGACMVLSYDELNIKDLINNLRNVEQLFNNNNY